MVGIAAVTSAPVDVQVSLVVTRRASSVDPPNEAQAEENGMDDAAAVRHPNKFLAPARRARITVGYAGGKDCGGVGAAGRGGSRACFHSSDAPPATLKEPGRAADHAVMGITNLLIGGFIGCWIVASFWLVATFVSDLTDKARQPISRR
jgi:hypothetical protein